MFLWLLLLLCVARSEIEEALLDKDLYKVLGVEKDSSTKDIKKAYRKLAQVHHPDKSTKANKDANEGIFMEIAAAYEVLSDEEQREEYDALRGARARARADSGGGRGGYHEQQRYQYQDYQEEARRQYQEYQEYQREQYERQRQQHEQYYQQQEHYHRRRRRQQEAYQQAYAEYMDEMESINSHNNFGPVFTDAFYPSGAVLLPYNPIMVSAEGTHFALLDVNCTLAVYRGNPDQLMSYLLRADSLELDNVASFENLYKSDNKDDPTSSSSLHGQCFTGLDDSGVIRIFAGHPDDIHSREVWASSLDDQEMNSLQSFYKRYYLELSDTGELFVLSLTAGSSEAECVWATTSCNVYIAIMKDVQNDVGKKLIQGFRLMKSIIRKVHAQLGYSILDFRDEYSKNGLKSAVKELLLNSIWGALNSINDIVRAFITTLTTIFNDAFVIKRLRGRGRDSSSRQWNN